MSKTINNYRLFCNTENQNVYTWQQSSPTVCPNNNTHLIDSNSITIVDSINNQSVNIIQTSDSIQGYYKTEGFKLTIPAGQSVSQDYKWPFDIAVLTINWTTDSTNTDDIVNLQVAPNTIIGIITQNIASGDTVLHVNDTVISNVIIGCLITISNGNSSVNMGYCLKIDKTTNTITCANPANTIMNPGSYVSLTVVACNFIIGLPDQTKLCNKHINTTHLPTNTIVRVSYQNNSNVDKIFFFYVEYLY